MLGKDAEARIEEIRSDLDGLYGDEIVLDEELDWMYADGNTDLRLEEIDRGEEKLVMISVAIDELEGELHRLLEGLAAARR